MAKKSLFGKIATVFREEEEESAEDIDKDVEAAVAAIALEKTTSLEGETVLHSSIGKAGDTVFVMDLNPIFAMIGGATGRAANGVIECCDRIFKQHREDPKDRGIVETTKFIMRFASRDESKGFHRAAIIVNEIGVHVLSNRFNTMEVPDILIAANVGDIADANGKLVPAKLAQVIADGGKPVGMGEPSANDPEWVKLRYLNKAKEQKLIAMKAKESNGKKEPEWVAGIDKASRRKLTQRSGSDRRNVKGAFGGRDQRGGQLERRGRGY